MEVFTNNKQNKLWNLNKISRMMKASLSLTARHSLITRKVLIRTYWIGHHYISFDQIERKRNYFQRTRRQIHRKVKFILSQYTNLPWKTISLATPVNLFCKHRTSNSGMEYNVKYWAHCTFVSRVKKLYSSKTLIK